MMQIKGKSASFRGLTLLLALMLGAGLALTGCGDDDAPATPAPAPAPTPPPQPPAPEPPGTPANLRVASTGVDYIEFSWDMVEGATGYVVQMSMMEGDFSSAQQAEVTGTMHKFTDVAAETAGYGRVRAMNDDGMSDWSDAVMGMSMAAPLMLGTPMPRVTSTGPDHIEWSWDAVENALAYQVRVADSMAGLEGASPELIQATMHRVDAEPEMEMYISVRAGAGTLTSPIVGDWSAPVRGMSDVAPMPFVVSMTPPEAGADRACSGQPMCPDTQTDPKKAMAGVNKLMMVTSSHDAQVSPMWIADPGAASVGMGDSTPFAHVSWNAMQSVVANSGVVFRFQRITTGAGQEPMPMGDMMYITCGPFECTEAADEPPDKPAITIANSAACTAFEADLTLNVGLGYNGGRQNGVSASTALPGQQSELKRGIDAGWTYTSSTTATVMHEFMGLADTSGGSGNLMVKGANLVKTSTPAALPMKRDKMNVNQFGGVVGDDPAQTMGGPIWNGTEDCFGLTDPTGADEANLGYAYSNISGTAGEAGTPQRPKNCFRIVTAGRPTAQPHAVRQNFLSGYRVHVTPNASVAWAGSSVNWPKGEDPFDGLDCEGVSFDAVDDTDVCGSFQEEARRYWGRGVADPGHSRINNFDFKFEYIVTTNADETVDTADPATAVAPEKVLRKINIVPRIPPPANTGQLREVVRLRRPTISRWSSMWLRYTDKSTAATEGRDGTIADADLYRAEYGDGAFLGQYNQSGDDQDSRIDGVTGAVVAWRPLVTVELIDSDGDPVVNEKATDLGKVDFHTSGTNRGKADNFASSNSDAHACSSADNGSVTDENGGNGACDAEVEFEESFTLTLYQDTNECMETIEVSFTCTWDADGDDDRTGDMSGTAGTFGTKNIGRFLTCNMS